jgi:hypothetical protein
MLDLSIRKHPLEVPGKECCGKYFSKKEKLTNCWISATNEDSSIENLAAFVRMKCRAAMLPYES